MSAIRGRTIRHAMATALGAVLLAGVVPAYTPNAAAAEAAAGVGAATAAPAPSESQKALAEAAKSGQPVEVIGERSEFATTYANPDGKSFRLDQSVVPVRVKAGSGDWVKPDATLEVRPDGTVGPKAAVAGVSFSGGGDKAGLVTIRRGAHTMSLGWPGKLPKPVLDGDSAVYPEVLPGVDLRMTATEVGFREVLVVKTPQAAKNPRLKRIEFALKADRLRVNASKGGGMVAADANGNPVFTAPPARMWDSKGDPAVATQSPRTKSPALKAEGGAAPDSRAAAAPEETPADGPTPGDQVADMPIQVGAESLAVVPDAGLLGQTDPAAFPLYIDPDVSLDDGTEHTALRNDGVSFWNWDNGSDNMGKGMGKCGSWNGYYCGPGYVQRLYFEFSPNKLAGKEVLWARFRITEPWAFQCSVRNVWLVRMDAEINPSTTWSNKPNYADLMGDRWLSAGRGSACDPDSPAAPVEFSDAADEPDENLTPTVRDFANGRYNRLVLELRAEDESDTAAWKRFRNDAVLSVDYISKPNVPIYVGLVAGSGEVCTGDASKPTIVSDPTPALTAITETVWGGEPGASLRIAFQTEKKESDGSWGPVRANPEDPWAIERPSSGYVADNVKITSDPPATLQEGALYRFRAWTKSFAGSNWRDSAPSGDCYFKVDPSAPNAPVITFGSPYSACTSVSCTAAGKPGTPGQFTFGPGSGDTNTAYQYKLATASAWTEVAGAQPTVSITPPLSGTMRLSVKAKDSLGRWGAENIVDFVVKEGPGPVAHWNFDEFDGQAVDVSTTDPALRDNADLAPGSLRTESGRRGWVETPTPHNDRTLQLSGSGQYAITAKPVIDTRASFTVAGWVRLDRTDGSFSLVGQAGQSMSGVAITAWAGKPWMMQMATEDTVEGYKTMRRLTGTTPAQAGVWTHVAATYNDVTDIATLYVNGVSQGSMTVSNPIASPGAMSIGFIKHAGNWVDYLPGRIDELKVWQEELTGPAVKQDASLLDPATGKAYVELAGAWDLSQPGTLPDTSGYGRNLTTTAGTSVTGGALALNGTTQAATAAGPLVDDSGSFSVTAEATLDRAALLARPNGSKAQVLGQRTTSGSSWGLWFEKTANVTVRDPDDPMQTRTEVEGKWYFGRLTADGSGPSVVSEAAVLPGAPVQVTGVRDAQTGTVSLYFGATPQGAPTAFTSAVGTAEFAVGKGFTDGAWGHYLPGTVKGMRVWSGAFRSAEQVHDVVLTPSL
ncbi:LamG domain-containing protein [Streptomyces sp. ISL-86]|uniref:LamG domain-containing protein n=1 Tax=Streptomyces sp. ISL-86 TaxID=2819187 RepID=UPI0020350C17|nr:LamG domain-containing protein [Streptomyces sp. ISL-86]